MFVHNSGKKIILLRFLWALAPGKRTAWSRSCAFVAGASAYILQFLSSIEYVIRLVILCASLSKVGSIKYSNGLGCASIVVIPKRRGYARFLKKICELGRLRGLLVAIQVGPPSVDHDRAFGWTLLRWSKCAETVRKDARRRLAYFLFALLCQLESSSKKSGAFFHSLASRLRSSSGKSASVWIAIISRRTKVYVLGID